MAALSGVTYHVVMDFGRFKQLYLAQNQRYMRKVGIGCAVVGWMLSVSTLVKQLSGPSLEGLSTLVLMVVIAVFGTLMAVRPFTFFQTRKNEVYSYFANHGAQGSVGDALEGLSCEFDVRIEELGFVEVLADGSEARVPWFSLTGESFDCDFGNVFPCDDGKNSSMLYNMLGINAYLREGLEGEPLVVPMEVLGANPGLHGEIASLIAAGRKTYGKGVPEGSAEEQRLTAWLGEQ
ncbi:hypothetical protein [uncultured Parolsenella sp.]|uniref:hypothetical protein n=1 Tax=uncultured Parolsenella sp. TaxID=2083008 RepID=UPI0025F27835|nr:hypothetical protein [uncultured Parolsenella sp.]